MDRAEAAMRIFEIKYKDIKHKYTPRQLVEAYNAIYEIVDIKEEE